jgi:hypothetical protein
LLFINSIRVAVTHFSIGGFTKLLKTFKKMSDDDDDVYKGVTFIVIIFIIYYLSVLRMTSPTYNTVIYREGGWADMAVSPK